MNNALELKETRHQSTLGTVLPYLILLLIALLQLLSIYRTSKTVQPQELAINSDEAIYLGLAESLAQKGLYEFDFSPHTRFPPGLPLLLSASTQIFGANFSIFQLIVASFLVGGIILSLRLLQLAESRTAGIAAVLLLASSPYVFRLGTEVVNSDLPYFCSSLLTIYLALRLANRYTFQNLLGFVLALTFSLLLRSAGAVLIPAIIAWLLLDRTAPTNRRIRFVPGLLLATMIEVSWLLWVKFHQVKYWPGDYLDSYLNQIILKDPHYPQLGRATLSDVLPRILENTIVQSARFTEILTHLNWVNPLWYSPLVLFPLALVATGLVYSLLTKPTLIETYTVFYIMLFLLWPYDEQARFIVPVFPLLFLFLWRGSILLFQQVERYPIAASGILFPVSLLLLLSSFIASGQAGGTTRLLSMVIWFAVLTASLFAAKLSYLLKQLKPSMFAVPVQTAIGILVLFGLITELQTFTVHSRSREQFAPSINAAYWIQVNSSSTDTIMAGEYPLVHQASRRRVVPFPVTGDVDILKSTLDDFQVKYLLVVDEGKYPYFFPTQEERLELLLRRFPTRLKTAATGTGYRILEYLKAGEK